MTRFSMFASLLVLMTLCTVSSASIYYVSSTGNDSADGLSWATAKKTLWQVTAITHAGDQIWVKGGYYPDFSANLADGVQLYGSFAGTETSPSQRNIDANPTVGETPYWTAIYTYPGGTGTRVDGFTLQNRGTAIYSDNTSLTIANCKFLNNFNSSWTPAVTLVFGNPKVTNCTFQGNHGAQWGGALYAYYSNAAIQGCTFTGNVADWYGGGVGAYSSTLNVRDCTFSDNYGALHAGAIAAAYGGAQIVNNTFNSNNSPVTGAVACHFCDWDVITDNSFSDNACSSDGPGALRVRLVGYATIERNIIRSNTGVSSGGIWNDNSWVQLFDNTIEKNTGVTGGGLRHDGSYINMRGNQVRQNSGGNAGGAHFMNSQLDVFGNTFEDNTGNGALGGVEILSCWGSFGWNVVHANHGAFAGGLRLENTGANLSCLNNRIYENISDNVSGGIEIGGGSPLVTGNLIYSNTSVFGGGIGIGKAAPFLANNTIANNTGTGGIGGINVWLSSPTVQNNIIAFNVNGGINGTNPQATLNNNCIFGNSGYDYAVVQPGLADVSLDPHFLTDFHLSPVSGCIDAGTNAALPNLWSALDIYGQNRVSNITIDIGAFEFQGAPDRVAPVTTASISPAPNANSWNNSDVTVTLHATDQTQVESISYRINGGAWTVVPGDTATFPVTAEGVTSVDYWAMDGFNVEPVKSLQVKIDRVVPDLIWGSISPTPLGNGWNRTAVDIPWTASDGGSGIASPGSNGVLHFTSEGSGQTQTVTITDMAGNSQSFTSPGVNIDLTPPTASPGDVSNPVWRNTSLSQVFTSSDGLSGLADPSDASFTITASDESKWGVGPTGLLYTSPTVATHWIQDKAGNYTSRSVTAFIDYTPPTTTCTLSGGTSSSGSGTASDPFFTLTVSIALAASDPLSHVAKTYYCVVHDLKTTVPGSATWQTYNGKINDATAGKVGDFTVFFYSVDRATNKENVQYQWFTVKNK